jgi:hypothetical protein
MACGVDIRSGLVDFRMDGEGREVNWFIALNDITIFVDKYKVRNLYKGEVGREGIYPCGFGQHLRLSKRIRGNVQK